MGNLTSFVVNVMNNDRTPKVEREMTPEEYEAYKAKMAALQEKMRENAKRKGTGIYISLNKGIDMPLQNTEKFAAISYHKPGFNQEKTIATSGNFPLTVQAVLKYFGKEVTLEELIQIAHHGDWISKGGGTYWHYIDAVCYAYNLSVVRIATFEQINTAMENGGLVLALLKNDLFPEGLGNHLSVITRVSSNKVFMKSTSRGDFLEVVSGSDFLENCIVLWAVVE